MRRTVLKYLAIVVACVSVLSFTPRSLEAGESRVYVEPSISLLHQTVNVEPGRALSFNFPLERGMTLVAEFDVQGGLDKSISVYLLDLPNFQRFSAGQSFSIFKGTSGRIREVAKYRFVVPQTNVYYLILDNSRSVLFARNVKVYAYAISPKPTQKSLAAQQQIEKNFYQELKKLFVFPDFSVSVRHCGLANAYSTPDIILCVELVERLHDQKLENAVTFVLFHELGHSLLRVWGYPLADNEDAADEFATVFLMLGNQGGAALEAAQWWASQTSEQEARAKLWVDDRHTLSPQRARNIIRWLNQKENLLRRWQKILVPNMQTEVLKSLDKSPKSWVDHSLVRAELARRTSQPEKR